MLPSRPISPEALQPRTTLWMSTPIRMALVVVLAVAALVLALWFIPADTPPIGQASPSPTATVEEPSPSLEPSLTPGDTSPAVPTPTVVPTPTRPPTPGPTVAWTSLEWSSPVVSFPHEPGAGWPGIATSIDDILWWNDQYFGVGAIAEGGTCSEAAFFRSTDGLHWDLTFRAPSGEDRTPTMCPRFIGSDGDGLIALGQERIWRSSDGLSWFEPDRTGLREVWTGRGEELVAAAISPAGIVVIGQPMNGYDSIVAFSEDGIAWTTIDLPAREEPIAWDVLAWRDRFVIVGRDGTPDGEGAPSEPYIHPGVGAPAAWTSADGRSWIQAEVEGDPVKAGVLSQVVAGSGGLMAIGNDCGVNTQYEEINDLGIMAWTSADGASWRKIGPLDALVPRAWMLESDGRHVVALDASGAVMASVDGRDWELLTAIGEPDVPPFPFLRVTVDSARAVSGWDWKLWVTPAGPVYAGQSDEPWPTHAYQVGVAVMR